MSAGTKQRICTFHLGDELFGIDVAHVQEVLVSQRITPVPLAPAAVLGVVNLRGQIVTAIDLRTRLELPPRAPGTHPVHVVVRTEGELVSFLVDRTGDVVDVSADAFERPPEALPGVAGDLILGAFQLPDTLLLLLDPERTTDLPRSTGSAEGPREAEATPQEGEGL